MAKTIVFKNDEEKRDSIIIALRRLKGSLGWRVVQRALQVVIEKTERKLHGDIEWEKGDTIETLQDKRNDRVKLLTLPEDLMKDFDEAKEFPPELDPYE